MVLNEFTYVKKISFDFGGEIFKEYHVHDIYTVQHLCINNRFKALEPNQTPYLYIDASF